MFTRNRDDQNDGIFMWAWFLILPGVVIVTALLIRRLRDQARLPQAAPAEAHEFCVESSWRSAPSAELTQYGTEAEVTAEVAGSRKRASVIDAGQESAEAAEMETSTIREEVEVARTASNESAPGDDLQIIEGVGPKIEGILKDAGVCTFKDLANTSVEQLYKVLHQADLYMADPNTWPEQARLAANESWDFLKALQDRTKAGRRSNKD